MIHLLSLKKANPAWANTANSAILTAETAAVDFQPRRSPAIHATFAFAAE
jgi:hypothetical protein